MKSNGSNLYSLEQLTTSVVSLCTTILEVITGKCSPGDAETKKSIDDFGSFIRTKVSETRFPIFQQWGEGLADAFNFFTKGLGLILHLLKDLKKEVKELKELEGMNEKRLLLIEGYVRQRMSEGSGSSDSVPEASASVMKVSNKPVDSGPKQHLRWRDHIWKWLCLAGHWPFWKNIHFWAIFALVIVYFFPWCLFFRCSNMLEKAETQIEYLVSEEKDGGQSTL